jgi:hypothetical protein
MRFIDEVLPLKCAAHASRNFSTRAGRTTRTRARPSILQPTP